MRANVYIRKENEEAWAALSDKSAWVNGRLQEGLTEQEVANFDELGIAAVTSRIPPTKTCKHGANPRFCKHAKPGKSCK